MSCAVAIDTLKTDTAMLNALRNNPDFGYSRELVQVKSSTWQWMSDRLADWYQSLFNSVFPNENNWYLWFIAAVMVIGIIIAIVVLRNRNLLRQKENNDSGYVVTDDTIYGIDFEQQIEAALGRDDYRTALRMIYLQTLKWLDDNHHIHWQPQKTPSQYVREYRCAPFNTLTTLFIRIRYGGFEADRALVDEALRMRAAVCQEGASLHDEPKVQGEPKEQGEKGGER